jgi:hypothetical protein
VDKFFMEDETWNIHIYLYRALMLVRLAWHEGYPSDYIPDFKKRLGEIEDQLDDLSSECEEWFRLTQRDQRYRR